MGYFIGTVICLFCIVLMGVGIVSLTMGKTLRTADDWRCTQWNKNKGKPPHDDMCVQWTYKQEQHLLKGE